MKSRLSFGALSHAARLAIASGIVALGVVGASAAQQPQRPANNVIAHALDIEAGAAAPRGKEAKLSSGVVYAALAASGALSARADANGGQGAQFLPGQGGGTQGCSNSFQGNGSKNIRVNQDCSLRRQAESAIAINPVNPNNIIVGQNDSRIGFNHCGYDFSFDGGNTWGDQVPPFYQFVLKDGHTADACSDPTATFDAGGNAYVGGVLFDIASPASAFVVMKSNAGIGGAFYHTPTPLAFQTYRDTPVGVVASDNNPDVAHDKEFIVADAGAASPKKNNVYATWTRFDFGTGAGVGGHSPIYFSQSLDGGATWSPGVEISGASAACTVFSGEANPNACDQDQGSDPFVGPDGTIYVTFGNGNTPTPGVNQVMIVSCPPTSICSSAASWTAPVKVADLFDFQPVGPNAATACPGGRQCLPPNGYRLDDFVEISGSVDNGGRLYVAWADGRNIAANCQGPAATAVPPCDNDVFYAYSTNHGATWSAPIKLSPAGSAQWMPWSSVAQDGSTLFVAYYDRSYGNCEQTGCNDITLARVTNPASASPNVSYDRVTTSSMPNLVVANNPLEAGFLGDYMYMTLDANGVPNMVWSDTRGLGGTVEEDIYFARVPGKSQGK
jgi:hypothetical protein